MATQPQLNALEKWLNVPVKEMDFETASNALERLHAASETYNKAPAREKGIVKKTKETILAEFKAKHLLHDTEEEEARGEEESLATFANELDIQKKKEQEQEQAAIEGVDSGAIYDPDEEEKPKYAMILIDKIGPQEEEIIANVSRKLRACMPFAQAIIDAEYRTKKLNDSQIAELKEKIGVSIYIQASREGL